MYTDIPIFLDFTINILNMTNNLPNTIKTPLKKSPRRLSEGGTVECFHWVKLDKFFARPFIQS